MYVGFLRRPPQWLVTGIRHSRSPSVLEAVPIGCGLLVLLLAVHLFLTSVTLPWGPCNAAGLGGHCNLSWKIFGGWPWNCPFRESFSVLEHLFSNFLLGGTNFAPMCDSGCNFSGFSQRIADHVINDGRFHFYLLVTVWLEVQQVFQIIFSFFQFANLWFYGSQQISECTWLFT